MRVVFTIEVDSQEELATICGRLANIEKKPGELLTPDKPQAQRDFEPKLAATPAAPVKEVAKPAPAAPAAKAAAPKPAPAPVVATAAVEGEEITLDHIRPLAQQAMIKNHAPVLKQILTDAGAANVSTIPEDKIQEVYDALKTLLG